MVTLLLARLRLDVQGSGAVPVIFEITIRRVAVVLRELVIVNGLREVLGLRFRKCTREYFGRRVISYAVEKTQLELTVIEVGDRLENVTVCV